MINAQDKDDTINKQILLNWLYSSPKDLPVVELGKWIEVKTNGKYSLLNNESKTN